MIIIRKRGCARAGLLGNPSDGYHGKTISIIVRDFWAEVVGGLGVRRYNIAVQAEALITINAAGKGRPW